MGEEILTLEEQKQILIDAYINLMRIKIPNELSKEQKAIETNFLLLFFLIILL